jgi:hypothetical protein
VAEYFIKLDSMIGNQAKKLSRPLKTAKQMKKSTRGQPFEIIDRTELESRFSNLYDVLIVKFGSPPGMQSRSSQSSPLFVLSPSLPFVFEIYSDILNENLGHGKLADIIFYLSRLRRIRIIQSLKAGDGNFFERDTRSGGTVERIQLEIGFLNPLTTKRLKSLQLQVSLKIREGENLMGTTHFRGHGAGEGARVEFPTNCCIVSLKLTREATIRSFTCLVWFMEMKFKPKKAYFCSVKLDLNTKVNLYFIPKQLFSETSSFSERHSYDTSLVLSKVEVSISSQSTSRDHLEKYEYIK